MKKLKTKITLMFGIALIATLLFASPALACSNDHDHGKHSDFIHVTNTKSWFGCYTEAWQDKSHVEPAIEKSEPAPEQPIVKEPVLEEPKTEADMAEPIIAKKKIKQTDEEDIEASGWKEEPDLEEDIEEHRIGKAEQSNKNNQKEQVTYFGTLHFKHFLDDEVSQMNWKTKLTMQSESGSLGIKPIGYRQAGSDNFGHSLRAVMRAHLIPEEVEKNGLVKVRLYRPFHMTEENILYAYPHRLVFPVDLGETHPTITPARQQGFYYLKPIENGQTAEAVSKILPGRCKKTEEKYDKIQTVMYSTIQDKISQVWPIAPVVTDPIDGQRIGAVTKHILFFEAGKKLKIASPQTVHPLRAILGVHLIPEEERLEVNNLLGGGQHQRVAIARLLLVCMA